MGLNIEYVGDINYRVCDLVNNIPDKSDLNKKFIDYIYEKIVTYNNIENI